MSSADPRQPARAAPAVERTSIPGPAGALEAVIEEPGGPSPHFAVVCHPHPLYGGTLDNKVVTTAARALQQLRIPTVRFNFRGVGASAGRFDQGVGETDDAAAVVEWGMRRWPGRSLVLAGFSFGAYVALRLARTRPAAHTILIAPPVALFAFAGLEAPAGSWLVIQGDQDEVVDPAGVNAWTATFTPPPRLVLMPGAGHFFHGRLPELRDAVISQIDPERLNPLNRPESA